MVNENLTSREQIQRSFDIWTYLQKRPDKAAICQYRESLSMQDALNRSSGEETSDPLSTDIMGDQVAVSLAELACAYLSRNELTNFINFFLSPQAEASDEIAQRFDELSQEFCSLEIEELSERLDRLAQPSGVFGCIIEIKYALSVQRRPSWPLLGYEKSYYPGPRYQGSW